MIKFSRFNLFISALLIFAFLSTNSNFAENKPLILYFFWGDGCPHCAKEKEFLNSIKKKYPQLQIKDYEVWHNQAPRQLLFTMSQSYGINPSGVPVTFIADKAFVGFNEEIAKQIEQTLKYCLKKICEDPLFYKKH